MKIVMTLSQLDFDAICENHILLAISEIDKCGVPSGRESRSYDLLYRGKLYPPKYVIALAHRFAVGYEPKPNDHSGGVSDANRRLKSLGFTIVGKGAGLETDVVRTITSSNKLPEPISSPKENVSVSPGEPYHSDHCKACKERVEQLLCKLYGNVIPQFNLKVKVRPNSISDPDLLNIFHALTKYCGHHDFVKSEYLRPVDFYLPDEQMVVEFDESQHFTAARKLSLENYPKDMVLGFDTNKWINECLILNRTDSSPIYRDEQRAWYDTIRDFLPRILGIKSIIRLSANDMLWCELNIDEPMDLYKFETYLKPPEILCYKPKSADPVFARIVISNGWEGNISEAARLLEVVCNSWPAGYRSEILVTCAAFIQFTWPRLTHLDVGDIHEPNRKAVDLLIEVAKKSVSYLLTDKVKTSLKEHVRFITIGVDSYKSPNDMKDLHIELVCFYDLLLDRPYFTGKTYPLVEQEDNLVRITDYDSHFVKVEDLGTIMILGCHDLNAYNQRNLSRTRHWRVFIKEEFHYWTSYYSPRYILHHPHFTVKINTWRNGWAYINDNFPSVEGYVGSGIYSDPKRKNGKYDGLNKVLKANRRGDCIDFIVK